jgi:hypothetical protein
MKIIIYATHSHGNYEKLKKHPDVVVLGFGTQWEGFIKKAQVIYDYLNTLPKNEIVSIIDGFDSYIKHTDNIEKAFKKLHCKVLTSLHNIWFKSEFIEKTVFKTCKNNMTANSGLMMGYVKELKTTFKHIINGPSNDDQRNLNIGCKKLPFIKVDVDNIIFENCASINDVKKSNAYMCQIPGTLTFDRIFRGLFEYTSYFIIEIIIIILLIVSIIYNIDYLKLDKQYKLYTIV